MKTLEEAKIIARTSDPDWVGEELFRLQNLAQRAIARGDQTMKLGDTPELGTFEYEVSIQLWLPLPHAELLRTTALLHYDHVVRESAERGAINALRNRATFHRDDTERASDVAYTSRMRFRDLDTAMKAMEQCRPQTPVESVIANEIRKALGDGMDRINARSLELHPRG